MNVVKVRMADLNTIGAPARIRTTGLGSCVGIVLFDVKQKVGGMAHIMLPSSEIAKDNQFLNRAKYADTAVPLLFEKMLSIGASKENIVAKLAGGSQMFQFNTSNDMLRIGPRNVEASKLALSNIGIPLIAEDTGGNIGRTIELDTQTGILHIKTANLGVKEI
ncbi:chemotaxis protein CheD [Vulcanibacillus modesticaldus]